MEHASIAAFGRFVLQLVGLGAPADLVRDAARAVADETRHAEMCFALAARFGAPRGPAPFPLEGALGTGDLRAIVADVIAEGCIGETLAALHAGEALAHARDEEIHAALAVIAEDEARHAELAWRFVKWALGQDASLHAVVEAAFASATVARRAEEHFDATYIDRLHAHGRLTETERYALAQTALAEVVRPCAAALLSDRGRGDSDRAC